MNNLNKTEGMRNVVLLSCGAFSPPTIMHFRMMEMGKEYLESKLNVHVAGGFFSPVHDKYGKTGLVDSKHRLRMLELGCAESNWLQPWDMECKNEAGWMRTAMVLQKLEEFTGCQAMLIAGSDILESFNVAGLWSDDDVDAITKRGIALLERGIPIVPADKLILNHAVLFKNRWNIHIIPQLVPDTISSTNIRRLASRGLSIRYLVQKGVEEYMHANKLYQ